MNFLIQISKQIRSILGQLSIGRASKVEVYIISESQNDLIQENAYVIDALTNIKLNLINNSDKRSQTLDFPVSVNENFAWLIQLDIKNALQNKEDLEKLNNSLIKLESYKLSLMQKLSNQGK